MEERSEEGSRKKIELKFPDNWIVDAGSTNPK
jgi:hypothetical protein